MPASDVSSPGFIGEMACLSTNAGVSRQKLAKGKPQRTFPDHSPGLNRIAAKRIWASGGGALLRPPCRPYDRRPPFLLPTGGSPPRPFPSPPIGKSDLTRPSPPGGAVLLRW